MPCPPQAPSHDGAPAGQFLSGGKPIGFLDLNVVMGPDLFRLPHVLRILLENTLRNTGPHEGISHRAAFLDWLNTGTSLSEIPFLPNRIMMHDTTCGPALVDIAAMRDVLAEHGLDPTMLMPRIPVDVSTDHSSGVDFFGTRDAFSRNLEKEFERNAERYVLMKWAAAALPGITVHPPGSGIMHTINLERLATVVRMTERDGQPFAFPDALLGTDSHTPMVNGLGVLGWGVGGLEAEGALFGVPVVMRIPEVVGVRLAGRLGDGVMATDLALTVTERLRQLGVAGAFVEFYGPGVSGLSVGERAAVANMAPEYGASTGYFPIDEACLSYLAGLGRRRCEIDLVRDFSKAAGLWFDPEATPRFSRSITIDLAQIEPSIAGPRRPQDRLRAGASRAAFQPPLRPAAGAEVPDGAVAIAAITSCTNTSDPRMLVAAGLLARKARRAGLKPPDWVKTSLAPGSPTAERMLTRNGLLADLEAMGFAIVGYGCTTCIGNSGALAARVRSALARNADTAVFRPVAVLSGNRNFPGRVHPDLDHGFLASPPLVIAFALAGTVNLDIACDALGTGADGMPVYLKDLWPSGREIDEALLEGQNPSDVEISYAEARDNALWKALRYPEGPQFAWNMSSTYLRRPPFATADKPRVTGRHARILLVLGDDITTDHISPANQIRAASEAGKYIVAHGGDPEDLNVFASRRGNFEVMVRGAFTNRLAVNQLVPDNVAGLTRHEPSGDIVSLVEAARRYKDHGVPLVIVAGERYGMGSSRDWAAKAVALLGVKAVIAASFERIHRTNLIGMGILPLLLPTGTTPLALNLDAADQVALDFSFGAVRPRGPVEVVIHRGNGASTKLALTAAVETTLEVTILQAGGIIPHVLGGLLDQPVRAEKGAA